MGVETDDGKGGQYNTIQHNAEQGNLCLLASTTLLTPVLQSEMICVN